MSCGKKEIGTGAVVVDEMVDIEQATKDIIAVCTDKPQRVYAVKSYVGKDTK